MTPVVAAVLGVQQMPMLVSFLMWRPVSPEVPVPTILQAVMVGLEIAARHWSAYWETCCFGFDLAAVSIVVAAPAVVVVAVAVAAAVSSAAPPSAE
jgi:hypothetical protein